MELKTLGSVSTYYLVLELMNDGNSGLLPELEPISEEKIVSELEKRTLENFGRSKDDWARWFLGAAEHASEMERANFLTFLETRKAMLRVLKKLEQNDR